MSLDWENKDEKQYLVRSLFEDVPNEDRELNDISKSPLSRSPRLVSPLRPETPLPPLIIEAMPDKHDHPPEYYRELEKKMIKVYGKMFMLDERSSSPESDKNYDICSLDTDKISQDKEEKKEKEVSLYDSDSSHHGHIEVMRRQEISSPYLGSELSTSVQADACDHHAFSALDNPRPALLHECCETSKVHVEAPTLDLAPPQHVTSPTCSRESSDTYLAPPQHVTLYLTNLGGSSPSYIYRLLSELYRTQGSSDIIYREDRSHKSKG